MAILKQILLAGLIIVLAVIAGTGWLYWQLPDAHTLKNCIRTNLYKVDLCPKNPNYVRLKDISPYMIHAVIAAEDGSFYTHKGFDWFEIKQSFELNWKTGKMRRGGSTLTQQLAKNVYLSKEKSFWRKIKEAYLAQKIEELYRKDVILEKYLNVVEFGPSLYGVGPASQYYFNKPASDLNALESAYLAHLLPNPKVYSRSFAKGELTMFSKSSVRIILKRMYSFGKLSEPAYNHAILAVDFFPWSDMTMVEFNDSPTLDFDTNVDAESLRELLEEEETRQPEPDDFSAPGSDGESESQSI